MKQEFKVKGMHCAACELFIEKKIQELDGVKKAEAKLKTMSLEIESDSILDPEELTKLVEENGYSIHLANTNNVRSNLTSKDRSQLLVSFVISIIFIAIILLLERLKIVNFIQTESLNLLTVFMIGIVASLSTCMAVVGGIVLSLSTAGDKFSNIKSIVAFHLSRILSFFILGGFLGAVSSIFILDYRVSIFLGFLLFVIMLILGLNLLDIFPSLSKYQFRMPKKIGKIIFEKNSNTSLITSAIVGSLTFILPCGFTQSMQFQAFSSGSILNGSLIMGVFSLGTFPILFLISFASNRFSKLKQSKIFFRTAGFIIIFFAIFNLLNSLAVAGLIPPVFNF